MNRSIPSSGLCLRNSDTLAGQNSGSRSLGPASGAPFAATTTTWSLAASRPASKSTKPKPTLAPFPCALSSSIPTTTKAGARSEEHTSELQSRRELVCRLLLEKKKNRGTHPYLTIFILQCQAKRLTHFLD